MEFTLGDEVVIGKRRVREEFLGRAAHFLGRALSP